MTAVVNKEDKEAFIQFWRLQFYVCWQTDMFEIIPNICLRYGYIKGIFEGELNMGLQWLTFTAQITFYTKK